ncbi:MAG: cbb3-type cytochrome c oxidase subunit I [Nitrosomonas sp.]|nr:cbb3-type cytochrome c oxidase subunit I [Nitrosomonas sp.]
MRTQSLLILWNSSKCHSPTATRSNQNDPALQAAQKSDYAEPGRASRGLFFRWTDVNNSAVGICQYTLTALGMMLFAGVLALIIRAQLAVPNNDLVSASTFNQLFTLHGSMMMFLFAVPMFEAVSIHQSAAAAWRAICRFHGCQPLAIETS